MISIREAPSLGDRNRVLVLQPLRTSEAGLRVGGWLTHALLSNEQAAARHRRVALLAC